MASFLIIMPSCPTAEFSLIATASITVAVFTVETNFMAQVDFTVPALVPTGMQALTPAHSVASIMAESPEDFLLAGRRASMEEAASFTEEAEDSTAAVVTGKRAPSQ